MKLLEQKIPSFADRLTQRDRVRTRGAGGTPIHYLYGYVPPNGVVIFEAPDLERVSISEAFSRTGYDDDDELYLCVDVFIFRTHESSSFVSSHLKLFKDRLLL